MAQSYHTDAKASTPAHAGHARTPAPAPVQVVHDYHSALNAITEPDKFVACTRYFVRRWMPLLGNEGTRIVLALRSLGYHNPRTGETRDGVEIELADLAALCGVSLPTLKREFGDQPGKPGAARNPALRRFVQKEQQYWRDPVTSRLLRTANIYRVKMDDPLHEDDEARLSELLARRQAGPEASPEAPKGRNEPQMPGARRSKAQNELQTRPAPASKAQNELREAHFDTRTAQNELRAAQNELTLKDYSPLQENISPTAALPGVSPSSLGEGKEPEGKEPEPEEAWRVAYRGLPDRERGAWGRKATLRAAEVGIRASDIPAISRMARELFQEHYEREHSEQQSERGHLEGGPGGGRN